VASFVSPRGKIRLFKKEREAGNKRGKQEIKKEREVGKNATHPRRELAVVLLPALPIPTSD
jgi:hypothetical protein